MAKQKKRTKRELRDGGNYQSRYHYLTELGFGSYQQYLASDLWKKIRARVYRVKGKDCYLCGSPATELHHNRYHRNDLLGKRLKYIHPLCRTCHEEIEFKADGRKSNLRQAMKAKRRNHLSNQRDNQ